MLQFILQFYLVFGYKITLNQKIIIQIKSIDNYLLLKIKFTLLGQNLPNTFD